MRSPLAISRFALGLGNCIHKGKGWWAALMAGPPCRGNLGVVYVSRPSHYNCKLAMASLLANPLLFINNTTFNEYICIGTRTLYSLVIVGIFAVLATAAIM